MKLNEYIEITNEDNMELMVRYPDKYFDLAIVDPPYGINVNVSMGRRKGDKKAIITNFQAMIHLFRIKNILMNYSVFQKIRLCGVEII